MGNKTGTKRNVLVLGGSGLIAPHVTPALEDDYQLQLADIKPHPDGRASITVDITRYDEVLEACRGMDAVVNMTVVRNDPTLSYRVNTIGARNVMKAAAECGIDKVIHTGPEMSWRQYAHHFGLQDPPLVASTKHYELTKYLSYEICRIYAQQFEITTPCLLFGGLYNAPVKPKPRHPFLSFMVIWEDVQQALRLSLDVESLPDYFQTFNILTYETTGKYGTQKAQRLLGYKPSRHYEKFYKREKRG